MLKSFLAKTPVYRFLLYFRSICQLFIVVFSQKKDFPTIYCISPYKTGTTYFSGIFKCKSAH